MIIVKAVPGIPSQRDLLNALSAHTGPGESPTAASGGFAVSEQAAARFLAAYLDTVDDVAPDRPEQAGDAAGIPRVTKWEVSA